MIQHVQIGDKFSGVYYVEQVYTKKTVNNSDYMDMTLRDRSGRAFVKCWDVVPDVARGKFVSIEANAEDYRGSRSIIAKSVVPLAEAPSDLSHYIPVTETIDADAERLDGFRKRVCDLADSSKDQTCPLVLDETFSSAKMASRFCEGPGGIGPHYGRRGGLLLQTVKLAEMSFNIGSANNLSDGELCLLLAASLLCRVGAVEAYHFADCMPAETTVGTLMGVDMLTAHRLMMVIKRLAGGKSNEAGVRAQTARRLVHAVVSCREVDVKPMTKEALVLAQAYRADSELVASFDFIEQDENDGEEFTAFDPFKRRRYLRA